MWEQRHTKGLPLRPVLIHTGYLKDSMKSKRLREMGLWAADEWRASMAPAVIKRSQQQQHGGGGGPTSKVWLFLAPVLAGFGFFAWKRSSPSSRGERAHDGAVRRPALRR